jgi:hypothetical protein
MAEYQRTDDTDRVRPSEHDRGLAEGARLWARMRGLPVPARGEVPPTIVRQYRRRTAPN